MSTTTKRKTNFTIGKCECGNEIKIYKAKQFCDECLKKRVKANQAKYREKRRNKKEICQCGNEMGKGRIQCDDCINEPTQMARRNRRDPNSATGKLLKRIGKPKSAIERCY